MEEARELVAQMTLEEKASLCSGRDFWTLKSVARLGLGPTVVSDGPCGLRRQREGTDHLGMGASAPATCFPAGVNFGATWNPELCRQMASAIALECQAEGVAVVLGPAINIQRNP